MQGADVTENKILFCHTDAGGIFCTTAGFRQEYIYVNEQKNIFSNSPISLVRIDFRVVKQLTYVDIYCSLCKHETPLIRGGAATAFVLILHINNLYEI